MRSSARLPQTAKHVRLGLTFLAGLILFVVAGSAERADGAVYNLRLITDNVPDYTDLESFVQSATGHLSTPQDKCIAVWRWGRRSRRQTSNSTEDGRLVWDPILHYNSYGTMNCGVISGLNIASFLRLGYLGRYIQLGDHTVSEVSWDDGATWHLFDSSMSFFCYNDKGVVASCEEIKSAQAGPFSGGASVPGYYYLYQGAPQCITHRGPDGWRVCSDNPVGYDRTLANGADSYTDGYSVDKYTLHARWGRRYVLNLLPHQSYTRYFRPLGPEDGEGIGGATEDYYRPVAGKDPDAHHDLHNVRANGVWVFEPDLAAGDCRNAFYDARGVETIAECGAGPAIHPAEAGGAAEVVFKVPAANVITSMRITGEGVRTCGEDILRVSVSRYAGIDWTEVWRSERTGGQSFDFRLRDAVAGVTECLVKVEMLAAKDKADVGIDRIAFKTLTQVNRRTLPKLTLGTNRLRLAADEQTETTVLWPPLHDDQYKKTVHRAENMYADSKPDGMYKATLGAGVNGTPCEAVWRVDVPTNIVDAVLGAVVTNKSPHTSVVLSYSFDGERFTEFYGKADGDAPFDKQALYTARPDAAARQVWFKTVCQCRSGAAAYTMPGIQDVLMQVSHRARDARYRPVEVTYNWTEHRDSGDVTRSHTAVIDALPHTWTINVAGFRDPTMNWVRMNLKDADPLHGAVVQGYSDGQDVGPGFEPETKIFTWGSNLAGGTPYTVSRPCDAAANNPDTNGVELTNGKIIAPTDSVNSQKVQAATAFWSSGEPVTVTVDLGAVQLVAGVRVSTHQPNEKYCHPEWTDVAVSVDGKAWRPAGILRHNDLFTPPGDYEPWEHDDSPQYDHLPAAGRLAYSFPLAFDNPLAARHVRFTCNPQEGRGMGLSEFQVFDTVETHPAPPLVAPF
ncbi:MAG: hypothetical protein IH624_08815 [Phycisphaerae bacterium]|nr:hypothetical protein [Phycisphaerae bacterium]